MRPILTAFLLLLGTLTGFSQSNQNCEYWIDSDYEGRSTANDSGTDITLNIDVGSLPPGVHYFNFRHQATDGLWGPLFRTLVYVPENTSPATCEYWIDDDFEHRQTSTVTSEQPVLTIDGSKLRTGAHYFNFRVKDADGYWGPLQRDLFNIEFKDMPITGYQYMVDSAKVDVQLDECDEYTLSGLTIDLSDNPGIGSLEKGCTWNFNPAKSEVTLYRKNSLSFAIKFKNKANEWSIPEGDVLEFPDTLTKPMQVLQAGPQIKIAKVDGGSFAPLKITAAEDRTYYLQATQPCKMHLFDDSGNLLKTIGSDALLQGEKTAMTTGTYYGVVYNTLKDGNHPSDSLHLLLALEKHTALTPTISHRKDTVYISSEQTDVDYYYTLDNTPPTTQSTRYTMPFKLTHNVTVRAIAAGKGYAPSAEAVSEIAPFKVENVVFSVDGYLLTMQTQTENSVIYYTTDGSTPNTLSKKYESPVALSASCTVKAIAMRDYFTDSDITQYQFVLNSATVVTPKIVHSGNLVTISTTTDGAAIHYTLDGAMPTTESPLYEEPFELKENGIVSAIAVKTNYYSSSVSSMTVDWFKVEPVTFSTDGYLIMMNTLTPDATIYFTTDGTMPTINSTKYNGPVALTSHCTVTAFAVKNNFHNSEVTYFVFNPGDAIVSQPQILNEGNVISMKTATEGAAIYYTTDGTEPTTASTLYENPFTVSGNCTILAVAVKDKYINSPIGKFEVNWFKVADVVFTQNGYVLTMTTPTGNATIYYTKDGSTPTTSSDKYVQPITLIEKCTVRAFAVKDSYNNSDVTVYDFDPEKVTVSTPLAHRIGNTNFIELITTTEGASIYYTTDGTVPTVEDGTLYTQAFEVVQNCTVKAIGIKENYNNSLIAELVVDWFRVATPTFTLNGTTLTISCSDEKATVYYSIGEETVPSPSSTRYTEPIVLTDNRPVKAVAVIEGYLDSEVAIFNEKPITSLGVDVAYNGHFVTLTPKEAETIVYYTLDGTDPTESSEVYNGPIALSSLVTVKAAAMRPYTNMSAVTNLEVSYVYDGYRFCAKEGGLLMKAIDWCGASEVKTLCVTGPIDNTDLAAIRSLPNLQTLDMEQAQLEGKMLPEDVLRGAKMRWFVSPANISSVGKNALADCRHLAAISWKSPVQMTSKLLGDQRNPNMLFYVSSENMVALENVNVISNGHATNIMLYDGEDYHDFYCPENFSTDEISYVRHFKMKTQKGVCQGWETLALPFKVQTITHWKNGTMVPFAARQENDERKPFWLAKLDHAGFISTDIIEANTPYIISMPNDSAVYADRFLMVGNVTFSAKNTEVVATDVDTNKGVMNDVAFVANFALQEPSSAIYALNLYEAYDATHMEGSIFLPNYRQVRPFEAYTGSSAIYAPRYIAIDDLLGNATDIVDIQSDYDWLDKNTIKVYDLKGLLIKTITSEDELKRLPKGVYIVNGQKVVVK